MEAPGETPGEAGFRIPNRTRGFVCGWLLLALLPAPSPPAKEPGLILEKETIGKYPTRPVGDAPAAGRWVGRFYGFGNVRFRATKPPARWPESAERWRKNARKRGKPPRRFGNARERGCKRRQPHFPVAVIGANFPLLVSSRHDMVNGSAIFNSQRAPPNPNSNCNPFQLLYFIGTLGVMVGS